MYREGTFRLRSVRSILDAQPAIVTGANSGIGRSIALSLAAAGADIALNFLTDATAASDVAHEIENLGRRCIIKQGDVSNEDDVIALFKTAIDHFGTIHIAVANAGIQRDSSIEHMSIEDWNSVIAVNLTGHFLCAREATREYLRRGVDEDVSVAAGKVIFISSIHESVPWGGRSNYAASKAGGAMLMKSIAQELAPRRIRANSIAPGAIRTNINRRAWESAEAAEKLSCHIPYGRIGDASEIGNAAVWLVSDNADYINGTTIFVDGALSGRVG